MKKTTVAVLLLLFAVSAWASEEIQPKTCEQCPPSAPCGYSTPSGCNTCSGSAYCVDGKWYSSGVMSCTTAYCGGMQMISNPFEPKGELPR